MKKMLCYVGMAGNPVEKVRNVRNTAGHSGPGRKKKNTPVKYGIELDQTESEDTICNAFLHYLLIVTVYWHSHNPLRITYTGLA